MPATETDPIARVYVTNRKGGVSCRPAYGWDDLERQVRAAHRRGLDSVAYTDDEERRVLGQSTVNPEGERIWWCETAEPNVLRSFT